MTILLWQKPLTQVVRQIVQRDNGAWFDPSDMSTLYQDAAGTTPVTAVGQPVGKMLDKSGNGYHATQSITASRPKLLIDVMGYYYLAFDGIDDYFNLPWMNLTGSNLGTTTIVAMDSRASSSEVSYVLSEKTTYTPVTVYGPMYLAYGLSQRVFMMKDDVKLLDIGYSVQTDRANVFSVTDDLVNITQRKNGVITNRVAFTRPAMITNQTLIGASNHGGVFGSYLTGNLYGLIITKSALTDSQRIACERYLGRKSGVQL